jgi:hypothetical protein
MDLAIALAWAATRSEGVLITLRADGRAQSSDISYFSDGPSMLISLTHGRAKTKNMQRDPRVVLTSGPGIDEPVLGYAESSIVVRLSDDIELSGAVGQHLDNNGGQASERRVFTRARALLNGEPREVGLIATIVDDLEGERLRPSAAVAGEAASSRG